MMIGVLGCGNMADAIVRGIHQFDKSIVLQIDYYFKLISF
jgi:pyrroline-5-carboxylate reductase